MISKDLIIVVGGMTLGI